MEVERRLAIAPLIEPDERRRCLEDIAQPALHHHQRARRLLLHKSQIRDLWNAVRQKGVTIIPLRIYLKDGLAKLELATAKGKKLYDKRAVMAERDAEREAQRQKRSKED